MISLVAMVIGIAGLALAGFGVYVIVQAVQNHNPTRPGAVVVATGVVIAIVFLGLGAAVVEVEPNEVGVVFNVLSGELADTPLGPGLHVVMPGVQKVTVYSIAQQEYTMSGTSGEGAVQGNDAVTALTSDGQKVDLDVTIIYRISPEKVNDVHVKWQERYQDGLVRPALRNQTRAALTEFEVQDIYGGQAGVIVTEDEGGVEGLETESGGDVSALEDKIEEGVRQKLAEGGLEVTDVLIRNIAFSQEYVDAIERKQIAKQEAEEAQTRITISEREAQQVIKKAEGEKQAAITRAEGETEALRLVNEQLSQNPALIQWRYISELGDNVQIIVIPSNSPFLFDLESLITQAGLSAEASAGD